MNVKLIDTAYWLPKHKVSSDAIAAQTDSDAEFIKTKVGILNRHFLKRDEGAVDMAIEASNALLAKRPELSVEDIGLVIFVTQNPDVGLPHMAGFVQAALGIPKCASFDIGLGCSGFVYALSVAKGMMLSEGITNALIVTSDPYSKIIRPDDRDTLTVFGDGAAAAWLSTDNAHSGGVIGRADFGTDGAGGEHLMVQAGKDGLAPSHIWVDPNEAEFEDRPKLYMNGRAVFTFMMTRIPNSLDTALEINGLQKEDIDMWVFHQASNHMLLSLAKRYRLEKVRVPILMKDIGNTVSSSIPIVLSQIGAGDNALSGKTIMLSGFGVGLSWASLVIKYM